MRKIKIVNFEIFFLLILQVVFFLVGSVFKIFAARFFPHFQNHRPSYVGHPVFKKWQKPIIFFIFWPVPYSHQALRQIYCLYCLYPPSSRICMWFNFFIRIWYFRCTEFFFWWIKVTIYTNPHILSLLVYLRYFFLSKYAKKSINNLLWGNPLLENLIFD